MYAEPGSTARLSPLPVRPGSPLVPPGSFFAGKDAAPLSLGQTSFCNTERLNTARLTARSTARRGGDNNSPTAQGASSSFNRPLSPSFVLPSPSTFGGRGRQARSGPGAASPTSQVRLTPLAADGSASPAVAKGSSRSPLQFSFDPATSTAQLTVSPVVTDGGDGGEVGGSGGDVAAASPSGRRARLSGKVDIPVVGGDVMAYVGEDEAAGGAWLTQCGVHE